MILFIKTTIVFDLPDCNNSINFILQPQFCRVIGIFFWLGVNTQQCSVVTLGLFSEIRTIEVEA